MIIKKIPDTGDNPVCSKTIKHVSAIAEESSLDKVTNSYLLAQQGEEDKTYSPMQLTPVCPVPDWRTVAWYTSNLKPLA